MISPQNKIAWCQEGLKSEEKFLQIAGNYKIMIDWHPDKKNDKYATDFRSARGIDCDLKHVQTPFFKAGLYNCDPSETVTMNHKDYIRYMYKYANQDMVIIFWIQWVNQTRYGIDVKENDSVRIIRISELDELIRNQKIKCHEYHERRNLDNFYAGKHSWVIPFTYLKEIKKTPPGRRG